MTKVPNLRFKEFSEDWKNEPLSRLGTFFKGSGLSKSDLSDDGNPCVLYGELYTKYTEVIRDVKSRTNVEGSNMVLGKANDVLIPSSGETAIDIATASCLQQDDVILGGDLNVFRSNQLNGIFASYQLNTSKKFEIAKLAQGASVVHVYNDQLKKLKLSVPSLEEQEKIASFFSLIDKKIELQTEKVEELTNYKKGIMQKIFSQELRFKDENGNEYPEWKIGRLGEYLSNKGGTALEKYVEDEGTHNFISIGNYSVDGNYIDTGQRINLNDKTQEKLLNKNDLVMVLNDKTASGDLIGSTILIDEDNKYIYNQRSERLICNSAISPDFCWVLLNSKMFRKKVFSIAQGGTQIYVNFSSVKNLEIELPHLKEQEKIAHFIFNLNTKLNKEQEKLDMLLTYKKGLLQQMFI